MGERDGLRMGGVLRARRFAGRVVCFRWVTGRGVRSALPAPCGSSSYGTLEVVRESLGGMVSRRRWLIDGPGP